jgi:SAM-dependent methyltransferase
VRNNHPRNYWDSFYEQVNSLDDPSPFAQFIQSRFPSQRNLIDVGCGNGRDTFFFAQRREKVVGIDASKIAIDKCNKIKIGLGAKNAEFVAADISVNGAVKRKFDDLDFPSDSCAFYARFFLHAITGEAQKAFFDFFAPRMTTSCIMCLEFRTAQDRDEYKVFSDHFRRFIDPYQLSSEVARLGLKTEYFDHGKGLAVYGAEDPYIARLVFSRS